MSAVKIPKCLRPRRQESAACNAHMAAHKQLEFDWKKMQSPAGTEIRLAEGYFVNDAAPDMREKDFQLIHSASIGL